LFVDAPSALARIAPDVDARAERQCVRGVELRTWDRAQDSRTPGLDAGEVVIEAFGCGLPPGYLSAMGARTPPPVWINLEYLTAESWIDDSHGLPSPQPRTALTRHFYFPGFTVKTGGLLRERGLLERRDDFRGDRAARAALWQAIAGAFSPGNALTVSLFCYTDAPVASLLDRFAEGDRAIVCLVPDGVANAAIDRWAGREVSVGEVLHREALTLLRVPFVAQDDYDRLLWSCDFNFVRGEDSFLRAQWAARPMVWQPYPQSEAAHLDKLDAFLARYTSHLAPAAAAAFGDLARGWSTGRVAAGSWGAVLATHPALLTHADAWARALAAQTDLAARLVKFVSNRV
jgi:uncharacterized repeat protein (TIGR03837 family)